MLSRIAVCIIFVAVAVCHAADDCLPVGTGNTFYDPTCAQGGAGCNAGGQNNCRFCGFDIYPPCPSATQASTGSTASTASTSRTTRTTRSTVSRTPNPNPVTGGPIQPDINVEYNEFGERLLFRDEFDTFDFSKWKHDLTLSGGGNWEFQLYHNNRTNSFVKDGHLHIHPTLTEDRIGEANLRGNNYRIDMWGGSPVDQCTGNNFYGCERMAGAGGNILNPIQSAKVTTVNSFNVKYGRVEVRAKLPRGDWLWPAIWMLPARNEYGMWPASGEIDIMEGRGNANYDDPEGGLDHFGSTLHWGVDWSQNRYRLTHEVYKHSETLDKEFHTYGLYWDDKELYTYFDDPSNRVLQVNLDEQSFYERGQFAPSYDNPWQYAENENIAPFDKEFYLIFNLAVGGTAGYFKGSGKPWSDTSNNAVNEFYAAKNSWYPTWQEQPDLIIDSVNVWQVEV